MADGTCRAAVFSKVGQPLEIRELPLPQFIEPGAALCKVRLSAICGSDLHTISGRRVEPTPIVLGHEILGEIVALGDGLETDGFGSELRVGDRVSWSIMASCGSCFYCSIDLPQKCDHLRKYGHMSIDEPPGLTGGYAEYIYLSAGTVLFKVPDSPSDEIATPANCALSTAMNAVETIGVREGETVLIQGAGSLGLSVLAVAAEAGAKKIIVTDIDPGRLELASRFGASCCINVSESSDEDALSRIDSETDGYGVDVGFEVSGARATVVQAVDALRIGGRYLIAGLVSPGSIVNVDANLIARKYLTIKGIHNYRFVHLGEALRFLERNSEKYPYSKIVGSVFPLARINAALLVAASREYIRVAIRPD